MLNTHAIHIQLGFPAPGCTYDCTLSFWAH